MPLLKENRPEHDFFLTEIFDNTPVKDDIASMEHPMFVLSKKKDLRCLEYHKDNVTITIAPSIYGLPNIFDKDILLYCGSLLMVEINAGRIPPRTLRVSSHDLLKATNRRTDGIAYARLREALDRLKGVSVKTNIKTGKREQTSSFGLIESYDIIESSRIKDRMIRLEITLSEWFYNSIISKEVLTINRNYFRLKKPMERRFYEIARKHCGNQLSWSISLTSLMEKTGSVSTLRLFRSRTKSIANENLIPDYGMELDSDDIVTFTKKHVVEESQPSLQLGDMPAISKSTLDKARKLTADAHTGWGFDALHEQFTLSLQDGFAPENVNGAFINFIKKKIAAAP